MAKTVNTVRGPISVEELGATLTHEHVIINLVDVYKTAHPDWPMSDLKVSLETRDEITKEFHSLVFGYADNISFDDEDLMVQELEYAKSAGINTIVDCSTVDLNSSPEALKRISERSGINIISSYGYYHFPSLPAKKQQEFFDGGENYIADEIIKVANEGINGIRPGVIKIGPGLDEGSKILMNAAAIAQRETGLVVKVHYGPFEMIDIFKKHKANVEKLCLDHWDLGNPIKEAMAEGAWVSFDGFGMNFPGLIPDDQRVDEVMALAKDGLLDRLFLSQDMCWKVRLKTHGGTGYGWLFTSVKDKLFDKGLTESQWNGLVCDNVKRFFG